MKVVYALGIGEANDSYLARLKPLYPAGTDIELVEYDETNPTPFYEAIKDADGIVTAYIEFDKAMIDRAEKCRVISIGATGFNAVDIHYAREKGIPVCAIGEYCTQEVADHTLTLMMALERQIPLIQKSVQEDKKWDGMICRGNRRLEGMTLGIFGFGKIGQAVGRRAGGFGIHVIAYDPYLPPEIAKKQGVELVSMDQIFEEADIISIHMNLLPENEALFNKNTFAKLKKKPTIINAARGAMIVEDDLVEALDKGLVRAAGLDVLEDEFPDMNTCKLVGRPNVILSPHVAYYSETSVRLSVEITASNVLKCLEGDYKGAFRVVNGVGQ